MKIRVNICGHKYIWRPAVLIRNMAPAIVCIAYGLLFGLIIYEMLATGWQ